MRAFGKLIIISSTLFFTVQSNAISKTVEFSADAVISGPQQTDRKSKLFVSEQAVRREMTVNGNHVTEIVFPQQGRALLINEQARSFQEKLFPAQKKNDDKGPCSQIKNSSCEKIGKETIDGIKTEKWQIISNEKGRKIRTLHWIDVNRKLAIREFFPDGSVSELKIIKNEKINSRDTEKWERILSRPDGQNIKSYQWYDKKLKIAVKEELPNGFSRELINIKVKKQPSKLFEPPVGYMKDHRHQPIRNYSKDRILR